mmetsp:Transcript_20822/g.52183  ORF Transcript_20822/g.52183 Transcript_20822/m.52183 type:complete len:215 (-) Transcript_20822:1092-1736(-)
MLPLVVKVRVPLEANHGGVDRVPAKGIPHPLAHHDANHDGKHILEPPRDLKHDDDEADRHAGHPPEHSSSPHNGVYPWGDAVLRRHARLKDTNVPDLILQQLHRKPDSPPQQPPDAEGGDEDAARRLVPEGDDGEEGEDHGGEDEEGEDVSAVFTVAELLEDVLGRVFALGKEGREETHVGTPEVDNGVADERGDAGAGHHFSDGEPLEERRLS